MIPNNRAYDIAALREMVGNRYRIFDCYTASVEDVAVTRIECDACDVVIHLADGGLMFGNHCEVELLGNSGSLLIREPSENNRPRWRFDPAPAYSERLADAKKMVNRVMDLKLDTLTPEEQALMDACMGGTTLQMMKPNLTALNMSIQTAAVEQEIMKGLGIPENLFQEKSSRSAAMYGSKGLNVSVLAEEHGVDYTRALALYNRITAGGMAETYTDNERAFVEAIWRTSGSRRSAIVTKNPCADVVVPNDLMASRALDGTRTGRITSDTPNFEEIRANGAPLGAPTNPVKFDTYRSPTTGKHYIWRGDEWEPCSESEAYQAALDKIIINAINELPEIPTVADQLANQIWDEPVSEFPIPGGAKPMPSLCAEDIVGDAVDLSAYPHTCSCGSPCYEGAFKVDCTNPKCKHHK